MGKEWFLEEMAKGVFLAIQDDELCSGSYPAFPCGSSEPQGFFIK